MERNIQIGQISAGWINGKITDGKSTVYFSNSYITNFLDDFMLAILTVLGEYPADEHKEVFRTVEEPTASIWRLSINPNDCISICIDVFSSLEFKNFIHQDYLCFKITPFLQDFIAEMKCILNKFGLYGYRLEWGAEFPLSLFLKLKSIADENDAMSLSVIPEAENLGFEADCTCFSAECKIINDSKI